MLNTCSYPMCGLCRRDGNLYARVLLLTVRNASEDLCNRRYPSSEMHTLAHATHPDSGTNPLLATASPKFLLSRVRGDWVELQLSSPASPSWHRDTAVSPRCLSAATATSTAGCQQLPRRCARRGTALPAEEATLFNVLYCHHLKTRSFGNSANGCHTPSTPSQSQ